MPEVKWQARRVSDGVLVDVTGDVTGNPASAPTPNVLAGLSNPVTEPLSIEPTDATSSSLRIVPPATLDQSAYVLNVKDINGSDAFTVTGDGEVQILPSQVNGNLLTINDSRAAAAEETAVLISLGGGAEVQIFTSGLLRLISALANAGLEIRQQVATDRPLQVLGSSSSVKRFTVDGAGRYRTFAVTAPADADVATSEMVVWFDNTNGASKLMIKGKSANGTVVTGNVALT